MEKEQVKVIKTNNYSGISKLLNSLNLHKRIAKEKLIILKPNLTCCRKFPVTTKPELVEKLIRYCIKNSKAKIIIAEGSGGHSTPFCYGNLGYDGLVKNYDIELIDLNETETVEIKNKKFKKFKKILYPKILLKGFIISIAQLKEHSEAKITLSLKNMLGCYPARHYGGNWKMAMHKWPIEYAIHDILCCKWPDFALIDGIVAGMKSETHPIPKRMDVILAGDPLEADKKGSELIGHSWEKIPHLVLAEELRKKK